MYTRASPWIKRGIRSGRYADGRSCSRLALQGIEHGGEAEAALFLNFSGRRLAAECGVPSNGSAIVDAAATIQQIVMATAQRAGLTKRVSSHLLSDSVATMLREGGMPIDQL